MTASKNAPLVAVLLTCFNRRDTTLRALAALPAAVAASCRHRVVLVDDGSTDGTGDAVRAACPDALVVRGDGNLFWNGGMRLAWQSALPLRPDFYLWLNDDTELRAHAVADLLALHVAQAEPRTIIVGRTADPETGKTTYGGYRRVSGAWSRLRFRHLAANEFECDTMNGNCVLIPAAAAVEIGLHAREYRHGYGDIDYGLRARRLGWRVVEMKPPVALQPGNSAYAASVSHLTWSNWRFIFFHPKGVALREWFAFCRAHGGYLWPVNWFWRYVKMAAAGNPQ